MSKRLPPDVDGQNNDRAGWAETAICAFQSETNADRHDCLCDLLADLGHWCDRNGLEFEAELQRAAYHYQCETYSVRKKKPLGRQLIYTGDMPIAP